MNGNRNGKAHRSNFSSNEFMTVNIIQIFIIIEKQQKNGVIRCRLCATLTIDIGKAQC